MPERLDRIAEHFDDRAARYHNPVTDFVGEAEMRVVRTFVPEGSRMLDYGCGTGRSTLDHLRRGCDVTAYDLSCEMLAIAKERARSERLGAEFTTDELALANRTWPLVTAIGVLDYYPDPQPLLASLRAHMALGGRLVVTWPNALSPFGWAYWLGSHFTYQSTPRTPAFVRRAAAEAGLRVERLAFAAPAVPGLGHTIVVELTAEEGGAS